MLVMCTIEKDLFYLWGQTNIRSKKQCFIFFFRSIEIALKFSTFFSVYFKKENNL